MREIELTISKDELKDKLGIKDVDMTPILESIASLKKELKKSPTTNNTEILNAIKLITNKKSDNSDIIKAIDGMAGKIVIPNGNQELILRFDKLVDALNSQGMFRPSYNSYNPQIRNVEGNEINPATEENQDTQITNQETIIDDIDGIETLLTDIKDNQTNITQKTQIFDSWGDKIGSTMLDQLMIAESYRISGGIFNGTTVDTNFYTTSLSANGTATIASSLLDLATTTDSGSSALLYANSLGRYVGANMNSYRAIKRFGDTGKTNNTRQFGVFNDSSFTDGFFFQLSGATFSIVSRTGGVDSVVNSGSFNGDVTSWTVDDIFHTFEILYTNRRIQFYISGVLIHTLIQTTSVICSTRNLRPFARNFNTGVGSVCHLYTQVMTISKHGSAVTQAKTFLQEGLTAGVLLKYGPGVLHLLNLSGVTNSSVVTIYDGLTTAGRKIWTSGTMGPQTAPFSMSLDGAGGTPFDIGLYLTITGAASNAFVKYE